MELLLPDKTQAPADAPALALAAYTYYHKPATEPLGQLTGRVLFYSPAYRYLAGHAYQHGVATARPTHLALATRPTPPPNTAKPTAGGTPPTNNLFACTPVVTDWYDGESGEYITTTYDYSNCQNDGSGGWPPTPPYGGTPYPPTGGGGGGGNAPTSSPTLIFIDQSVHNNPKAECILNKLQNNTQFNELLKNFQSPSRYNVSFNMGTITNGATGNCTWNTSTSTATILIDQSKFDMQHAIWGATTFFHETYHAQLQQFAIATFGTLVINNWPKPINNMTLQELIGCVDATANANAQWQNATHNYMAYNNGIMAEGLRAFVQANYPQTYTQVGNDISKYNYLSMMGLENTTRFTDEVTNAGKDSNYRQAIAEFITSELPDCL